MERFVCTSAMANRHSTPAPERLAALGITTPEQLHRDPGAIVAAARELAEGGEDLHVGCQFCDADYRFPPEEIRALLESLD